MTVKELIDRLTKLKQDKNISIDYGGSVMDVDDIIEIDEEYIIG